MITSSNFHNIWEQITSHAGMHAENGVRCSLTLQTWIFPNCQKDRLISTTPDTLTVTGGSVYVFKRFLKPQQTTGKVYL